MKRERPELENTPKIREQAVKIKLGSPMPDQSEAPIVQRLMTMFSHRGDGIPTQFVNPDGPEAAEIIRLCEEALERGLEAVIEGANERKQKDAVFENYMKDIRFIEAALAQIKGQNP